MVSSKPIIDHNNWLDAASIYKRLIQKEQGEQGEQGEKKQNTSTLGRKGRTRFKSLKPLY